MRSFTLVVLLAVVFASAFVHAQSNPRSSPGGDSAASTNFITRETVEQAERVNGLSFSDAKNDLLLPGLRQHLRIFEDIRKFPLSNAVPAAMLFNPIPVGFKFETSHKKFKMTPARVKWTGNLDDLAFCTVGQLAGLIKSRQLTSEALTRFYLERLQKYGPKFLCVVTLTEELALEQARRADREIAAGKYRGPLHGIRTTWGSTPYTNQVFAEDATVIKRLEEAGAVLVAKLTLGELAMGDVWFGGQTRNPWNTNQGSSGSSAGPAAAVAAGLVGFAIGTETHGSIV